MNDIQQLNETVFATLRASSMLYTSIHGIGVFAIRNIPKGTEMFKHHSIFMAVNEDDWHLIEPEIRKIILSRHCFHASSVNLSFTHPNADVSYQNFMNHSPDPNSDGQKALRDIEVEEEITENYRSFYTASYPHLLTSEHMNHFW